MIRVLLLCTFLFVLVTANAQDVRIGLKFSPGLAFNRAIDKDLKDSIDVKGATAGIRFVAGPEINFILGTNYVFTTGIWYASKKSGIRFYENGEDNDPVVDESWNVQYLQLPLSLKLYTNDIAVDTRLFFQLGGTLDFKLTQKPVAVPDLSYIKKYRIFDTSVLLGAGAELQLGTNTFAFAGISYYRGLLNSLSKNYADDAAPEDEISAEDRAKLNNLQDLDIKVSNDIITLDLGLRF